jgi:7-alpha-hydroxysteroid dehydrogenase
MSILDRFRMTDWVAVITGAGRGIGRATALAFADAGADVVLASRRRAPLEEVAAQVEARGRRALVVPTDTMDPAQLDALIATTVKERGRLDVLVSNAGGTPPRIALETDDAMFEEAFHFNVTAALHLARKAAPHLKASGHGAIVNVSSAMSHVVDSGFVAYGTAKAALNHMTRLLAFEWAPHIRVNALAAGSTHTDALEAFVQMEDLRKQMIARTPVGRLGEPEDMAAAILYLASPAGSYVTGKVLEVDGGAVGSTWPWPIPSNL